MGLSTGLIWSTDHLKDISKPLALGGQFTILSLKLVYCCCQDLWEPLYVV